MLQYRKGASTNAETYVHLLFRVLNLAVTVRTNRLDIRNFSFVHML